MTHPRLPRSPHAAEPVTYEDLLAAGAPELPDDLVYRVRYDTFLDEITATVCRRSRFFGTRAVGPTVGLNAYRRHLRFTEGQYEYESTPVRDTIARTAEACSAAYRGYSEALSDTYLLGRYREAEGDHGPATSYL